MLDVTDLDVCVDCILILANGKCDGCDTCVTANGEQDPAAPCQTVGRRIADEWDADADHLVPGCADPDCECGEGAEPWFSWSSCDGCGSPLGGDRYRAHLVKR